MILNHYDPSFTQLKSSVEIEDYEFMYSNYKNEICAINNNTFFYLNDKFSPIKSHDIETYIFPECYYYYFKRNEIIAHKDNRIYSMKPNYFYFVNLTTHIENEKYQRSSAALNKNCIAYDPRLDNIYVSDKKQNVIKKFRYGQIEPQIISNEILSPQSIYFYNDCLLVFSQSTNSIIALKNNHVIKTHHFNTGTIIKKSFFLTNHFYYLESKRLKKVKLNELKYESEKEIDFIPAGIFENKHGVFAYG